MKNSIFLQSRSEEGRQLGACQQSHEIEGGDYRLLGPRGDDVLLWEEVHDVAHLAPEVLPHGLKEAPRRGAEEEHHRSGAMEVFPQPSRHARDGVAITRGGDLEWKGWVGEEGPRPGDFDRVT